MKTKRYGTLKGLELPVNVYESYEEADAAAGKLFALGDEGNDNMAYRGPLADGRELICQIVETATGIPMLTKDTGEKDDKGNAILEVIENEGAYVKRVCAEKGWEDLKAFQAELDMQAAAANEGKGLSVDIKAKTRKSSLPKKLAAKYKDGAAKLLAGFGNLDKFAAAFENTVGRALGFTRTDDMAVPYAIKHSKKNADGTIAELSATVSNKDAETLGWLVKEYNSAVEAAALNAMTE